MRGRAFLGAFIALCLIAGCSSSSSDDAALREALDRIESLEKELEAKATTTVPPTTAPAPTSAPAPTTTSTTTTSTTTTSTTTASTTTTTIPSCDSLEQLFAYRDQRAYVWITINPGPKESGGRPYDEIDWETMFVYSGGPNHLDIEICTYGDGGNLQFLIDWVFENVLMGGLGRCPGFGFPAGDS